MHVYNKIIRKKKYKRVKNFTEKKKQLFNLKMKRTFYTSRIIHFVRNEKERSKKKITKEF